MFRVQKSGNGLRWILQSKNKVNFTSVFNTTHTLTKLKVEKEDFKKRKYVLHETSIKNEIPVNLILKDFQMKLKPGDVLVEFLPGRGVLTKKILSSFDNKLLVCKPQKFLVKDIKASFPSRLSKLIISDIEVQNFFKYFYQSFYHNCPKNHEKFVSVLESHSPVDKSSNMIIIGTVTNANFFYALICDYIYRASFFHGKLNPIFYLFVPYIFYKNLLKPDNMSVAIGTSYKLYFDIETLGSAPITSFHVPGLSSRRKKVNGSSDLFLLKITPKEYKNIVEKSGNNIIEFNTFLQYTVRLKGTSFLFGVESYIPDCGEELIKNGFRTFDKILDITEDQWYKCFEIIKSHRRYNPIMFGENVFSEYVMGTNEKFSKSETSNNGLQELGFLEGELQSDELEEDKSSMLDILENEDIFDDEETVASLKD